MIATTATEALCMMNRSVGCSAGELQSLTHKNLPLALFPETGDLGYPAWERSKTSPAPLMRASIQPGLGIVRFTEKPGRTAD